MRTRAPDSGKAALGRSTATRLAVVRLLWGAGVVGGLAVMLQGLSATVYFEPTGEAIAEARWGRTLVGVACCVLVAAAGYAVLATWPGWIAAGLLSPVVLCGGLTWLASETLFPQLALLVAYPAAFVGAAGGLVIGARRR